MVCVSCSNDTGRLSSHMPGEGEEIAHPADSETNTTGKQKANEDCGAPSGPRQQTTVTGRKVTMQ